MIDIKDSRAKIDDIDEKMVALFRERMAVAKDIAEYKKSLGRATLDESRERALLTRVSEMAGEELSSYSRVLYSMIMEISKSYQHGIIYPDSELNEMVDEALSNTGKLFPPIASVACQGVEGAYSQIAATRIFKVPNIIYYENFENVFEAVENGSCQYGVLPIENSTAGSVKMTYDLMIKHDFYIVRSLRLKIDHNLLAKNGTKLSDIKEIFSHEQAINQSTEYIKKYLPGVKVTVVKNTAMAAKMVAESDRTDVACLSSRSCANLYNLNIIDKCIQDKENNYTRFICFTKKLEIYPGADRTSFMMVIDHKPGALYRVMSRFYALNINLLKIESRPIPERDFEFMFYFDVEASVYSPEFKILLSEFSHQSEEFKYLGTYNEMV
ncbi:MAG: prephenate dehydratase [Clostridiales bacterium]|nr:prephenate dehydratase [Clostridiales bacterium]